MQCILNLQISCITWNSSRHTGALEFPVREYIEHFTHKQFLYLVQVNSWEGPVTARYSRNIHACYVKYLIEYNNRSLWFSIAIPHLLRVTLILASAVTINWIIELLWYMSHMR